MEPCNKLSLYIYVLNVQFNSDKVSMSQNKGYKNKVKIT